jgi:hypothetical protein
MFLNCPAHGIKQNATPVKLAVPNHGAVDSEKIGQKMECFSISFSVAQVTLHPP